MNLLDPNLFFYLDDEGNPQPCTDMVTYLAFWANPRRRMIARLEWKGIIVSTMFLGVNHQFLEGEPPILFETIVIGGRLDDYQLRYHTRDEAVEGHHAAVCLVAVAEEWDDFPGRE